MRRYEKNTRIYFKPPSDYGLAIINYFKEVIYNEKEVLYKITEIAKPNILSSIFTCEIFLLLFLTYLKIKEKNPAGISQFSLYSERIYQFENRCMKDLGILTGWGYYSIDSLRC